LERGGNDDLSGAAAEMAYRFFLALFPFLIFVAAVGGFLAEMIGIADPTTKIMDALGQSMPPIRPPSCAGSLRT